ncbi:DUF4249 family protein [Pareuzebyella sediminis]|uniref:DUF4249 family protein n=1 Tax=Pareuzebyella sediminis TaxID=2607998 RepID=UPI0011EDA33F|nr:DUF4249 family protein [Pareuzebyella sediminis]
MKKMILILFVVLYCFSCEDVIEVDVPTDRPRLMVDALMKIDTTVNSSLYTARVKVGATNDFFSEIEPVQLEEITLTNLALGETIVLNEVQTGSGVYSQDTSIDFMTSGTLELQIEHSGQMYRASTTFVPTVPIESLEQGEGTLFSGDETEILVSFTDRANREDFYLFDFDFNEYLVTEDEFYPGQTFSFSYFYEEGLESGSTLEISILGVDEPFYNYMNQLIVQSGGDQGPFQTPAATVIGNVVNTSANLSESERRDNFALGYFAVCQTYSESITIE